jgi:hypothetical protein
MEGELIIMGFMMLIGQIILMMMWQNNWFKKENFKIQKSNIMAQNKLQLRKLEKELGLGKSKEIIEKEPTGLMSTLGDLAPLLKNLDGDQIAALADKFLGGQSEAQMEEGGGSLGDMITDFAANNPEMVKGFLEGIQQKGKGNIGDKSY